jgi:hypothetical protein
VTRDLSDRRRWPRRSERRCQANSTLTIRLDRLTAVSWAKAGQKLRRIPGFKVIRDHRLRPRDGLITYRRVRELRSLHFGTSVSWGYQPGPRWLSEWRITWHAPVGQGIVPSDVLRILKRCRYFRFLLVELAFDFSPASGVDQAFVRRHGKFGKSRRRFDRGGPEQLRYGSRSSGKLIRAYQKQEVNAFRVEVEFHSRLLAKHKHPKAEKNYRFIDVPSQLLPIDLRKHFRFVRVDWKALKRYLARRDGPQGMAIWRRARAKAQISLRSVTQFLRRKGVINVHRFLKPLSINRMIDEALTTWLLDFRDAWNKLI